MRFFKFLAIAFLIYVCIILLAPFLLNNFGMQLPSIDRRLSELLGMSIILLTLPFTPLLKYLGMYVTAYWSMPTISGIILSTIIWEIIFVSLFLILRKATPPIEQNPAPIIQEKPKSKWKLILIIVIIVVALGIITVVVWRIYATRYVTSEQSLYDKLESMCKPGDGCCQTSVNRMRDGNYKLAQNNICQEGYKRNSLRCPTTFVWCEPELSTATTSDQFADWKTYINSDYNYQLSYPGRMESGSDLSAIFIDENSDPVVLCSAYNKSGWSSQQLFENWKNNPPKFITTGTFPEYFTPCADYPSYAKISVATSTVGNLPAYVVTSLRGPYKTVCTYIADSKTLFAACMPPEDPSKGLWQQHYNIYNQILHTFKFVPASGNKLLQICPDEWIQDDQPIITGTEESRQYYILKGKRRELSEFDKKWITKNCKLERRIVQ